MWTLRKDGISEKELRSIVRTYLPWIPDHIGLIGFLDRLRTSLLWTSESCWCLVNEVRFGCSAEIHGGKWSVRHDPLEDFDELVPLIKEAVEVKYLHATVPEHNISMISFAERVGFTRLAVVPFWGMYDGVPRSMILFSKEV